MRHISFMLLLCAAALASYAQSGPPVSFYISVIDQAYKPTVTGSQRPYTVQFPQHPEIDPLMQQYGVIDMQKAYPASRLYHLKQIYLITCADASLMDALQSSYPEGFAGGYADYPAVTFATPNDYGKNVWTVNPNQYVNTQGNSQTYLDLIRAEAAWDISKGDSNLIIGMIDRQVYRTHPDLDGKVLATYPNGPSTNPLDTAGEKHGTRVAGLLAGRTDNNKGLAAIGWRCRIANSAGLKDSTNLQMSRDGLRIINNSWGELSPCTLVFSDTARPALQNLYNEVYENGTFVVCAAGNGPDLLNSYTCADSSFRFPASWDHNFSVTSVGHFYDTATAGPNAGNGAPYNTKDVHQTSPNQGSAHNHNARVDLCAPGMGMTVYDYSFGNPTDTFQQYYANGDGTSYASPLVAGTAGLMLAASTNQCLTPYQLEYLLKTSAYNIANITANKPYAGKLGAGRLDARKADSTAFYFACNGTQATTMTISGVRISTLCFTGTTSQPQLSASIANGTPPYTYRWMALADNTARLDNIYSASPKVVSLSYNPYTRIVSFLLTVTDNSPVRKVASQRFYAVLKTGGGYDLAIADSDYDLLNDTNTQMTIDPRDFDIWNGPDLWNRDTADNGLTHQNAEYRAIPTDSNYLAVRIRNVGCAASPASGIRLRTYWTLAATGEAWPSAWTRDSLYFGAVKLPIGREISTGAGLPVPPLAPGSAVILRQGWRPPNPAGYVGYNPNLTVHGCVLARLEETAAYPYGMYWPEDTAVNVVPNVIRNNNIATHNMDIVNVNPNNAGPGPGQVVYVANAGTADAVFSLDVRNARATHRHLHGDLSEYVYAWLHLDEKLWALWTDGGRRGSGIGTVDAKRRAILYDPATVLRLDNLALPAGARYQTDLQFVTREGIRVYNPVSDRVYLRQLLPGAGADGEDGVYGAFGFELRLPPNAEAPRRDAPAPAATAAGDGAYTAYPNPARDYVTVRRSRPGGAAVTIRLLDLTGRTVATARLDEAQAAVTLPLPGLPAGLYLVDVAEPDGTRHRCKLVLR